MARDGRLAHRKWKLFVPATGNNLAVGYAPNASASLLVRSLRIALALFWLVSSAIVALSVWLRPVDLIVYEPQGN